MRVLLILVAVMGVCAVLAAATWAVVLWRLRRRNRVAPDQPSPAPLAWLWSPSTPARLHRRLRVVGHAAATVPADPWAPEPSPPSLARSIVSHACELDAWLVWSARAPSAHRRAHYRAIAAQVRELEDIAVRLASLESETPNHRSLEDSQRSLRALAEQVHFLEQASDELSRLEALTRGQPGPEPTRADPPRDASSRASEPPAAS